MVLALDLLASQFPQEAHGWPVFSKVAIPFDLPNQLGFIFSPTALALAHAKHRPNASTHNRHCLPGPTPGNPRTGREASILPPISTYQTRTDRETQNTMERMPTNITKKHFQCTPQKNNEDNKQRIHTRPYSGWIAQSALPVALGPLCPPLPPLHWKKLETQCYIRRHLILKGEEWKRPDCLPPLELTEPLPHDPHEPLAAISKALEAPSLIQGLCAHEHRCKNDTASEVARPTADEAAPRFPALAQENTTVWGQWLNSFYHLPIRTPPNQPQTRANGFKHSGLLPAKGTAPPKPDLPPQIRGLMDEIPNIYIYIYTVPAIKNASMKQANS